MSTDNNNEYLTISQCCDIVDKHNLKVERFFKKYEKAYNEKFNKNYLFSGSINVYKNPTMYFAEISLVVNMNGDISNYSKSFYTDINKNLYPGSWSYNPKTITMCNVHLINITDDFDELID